VFIAQGQFQLGAVILILGLPLDALDGAVARAMGRQDKFGGILDSTLDRYADALIFGGLSYYFAVHDQFDYLVLALAALTGSLLVSYVRARAGEAGRRAAASLDSGGQLFGNADQRQHLLDHDRHRPLAFQLLQGRAVG